MWRNRRFICCDGRLPLFNNRACTSGLGQFARPEPRSHGADTLLARLSYWSSSPGREPKVHEQGDVGRDATHHASLQRIQVAQYCPECPKICFALYRSGYYRISKRTLKGQEDLQGTLSEDQLVRVHGMLNNLDLKDTESDSSVLNGTESVEQLIVEIARGRDTLNHAWFDVDHHRPFPPSVVSIVNWLQSFKPRGESPLTLRELSDEPVCPRSYVKPLQPVAATLHDMRAIACARR